MHCLLSKENTDSNKTTMCTQCFHCVRTKHKYLLSTVKWVMGVGVTTSLESNNADLFTLQ